MSRELFEDMLEAVCEFHSASKQPPPSRDIAGTTQFLRNDLMDEENHELLMAKTQAARLDALADMLYVLLGTAIAYDLHKVLPEAFWRVHEANMAKFGPGSQTRADGKVLKPPGWQPPDLSDLV